MAPQPSCHTPRTPYSRSAVSHPLHPPLTATVVPLLSGSASVGNSGTIYDPISGSSHPSCPFVAVSSNNNNNNINTPSSSVTNYKHRRLYLGEEVELPEDASVDGEELDDFALASTHSAKMVTHRLPALQHSATPPPRFADSTPERRSAHTFTSTRGPPAVELTCVAPSRSPRRDAADEEVLEFVSLRRPGFSDCRVCRAELAFGSNFCSHCGTPTDQCVVTPREGGHCVTASPVLGPCSRSAGLSSMLGTPGMPRGDEEPSFFARSPTPTASELMLTPPSGALPHRRKAYRRRVKIIGRDETQAVLGSGASGTVYRAIDLISGQQLAVKEMLVDPKDSFEVAAIRRELRHLSQLRHQNVIEYLGCSIKRTTQGHGMISLIMDDDELVTPLSGDNLCGAISGCCGSGDSPLEETTLRVCILMERMECGSLEDLLEGFPDGLPEAAVRNYTAQLVDAVSYVHRSGVTHRDLKPANILLSCDGVVKLTDFGSAVVTASGGLSAEDMPDSAQHIAGTPAYMPPEALSAVGKRGRDLDLYGRAQDVWAIGCIVHHMLTGRVPWADAAVSNPFALLLHIQSTLGEDGEFPVDEALSPAAQAFCRRCFDRDVARRADVTPLLSDPFISDSPDGSTDCFI